MLAQRARGRLGPGVPWFPPAALPFVSAPRVPAPRPAPAHRAAHDRHHLVDVRLPLAALDGVRQAAVDVVLEQEQRDLVGGGGHRLDLLEDVEAVGLLLDEALDAARLALDPPQAGDEVALVLRVAVAEVGGVRIGRHTGGQYVERRVARSIGLA